jgi:YebC/PmpR family DNA-binding regulatory protein
MAVVAHPLKIARGILRLLVGRLVVTTLQSMSGHSKWSSIKHKKALKDARRGKLFTKLIKEITVAARLGGGDINANPRLRTAVLTARQNSMPTDNIDRAIKKGTGELEGVTYEEVTYEGYGPGGVALLVHALTDNRNRTVADVRSIIQKYGGNLGASGSVLWMFNKCGLLTVDRAGVDEDRVMEVALEAGADDVRESGDILEIVTAPDRFDAVKTALEAASVPLASAEVTMMPQSTVPISGKTAEQMVRMLEALEDHDDVQSVSSNMDIAAEELERLSAA